MSERMDVPFDEDGIKAVILRGDETTPIKKELASSMLALFERLFEIENIEVRISYRNPAERELVTICSGIAEYAHQNDIPSIAFVDRGARPAYVGVREAWDRKYLDEDRPDFYFINPTGFIDIRTGLSMSERMMRPNAMVASIIGNMKNNDTGSFLRTSRSKAVIDSDFLTTYPRLAKSKEAPLLLIDTCIHSGETIRPVLNTLNRVGFTDVRLGVMDGSSNTSDIQPDLILVDGQPLGGCYPFESDVMVDRTFASVASTRAPHDDKVKEARHLRQDISDIFHRAPDEWFYDIELVEEDESSF